MGSLWKNANYRYLFLAQVTSLAGTGISTIALALLAYELAGDSAGLVLGTALALKMVAYVFLAPVIGAWTHKLPRKQWLAGLDIARASLIMLLPLVNQIWQVYLLIFLINACSAGFTPVYQSLLPQVLPDREDYIKALSYSRVAYDLEQLLSPMLAGLLLSVVSFKTLFVADSITFAASGLLVLLCTIPAALEPKHQGGIYSRLSFGISAYLKTPRLKALWGAYFAVASGSAMLIVNTVVYVREVLQAGEQQTALAMSLAGLGSMLVALKLPAIMKRIEIRIIILVGAGLISLALLAGSTTPGWVFFLLLWFYIGVGLSLIQTSSGALVARSCHDRDAPAYFAANFSLSHLCWFVTYLLAGWSSARFGLSASFLIMSAIAAVGFIIALVYYPTPDLEGLSHTHISENGEVIIHSHRFVIDTDHQSWPKVDVKGVV